MDWKQKKHFMVTCFHTVKPLNWDSEGDVAPTLTNDREEAISWANKAFAKKTFKYLIVWDNWTGEVILELPES